MPIIHFQNSETTIGRTQVLSFLKQQKERDPDFKVIDVGGGPIHGQKSTRMPMSTLMRFLRIRGCLSATFANPRFGKTFKNHVSVLISVSVPTSLKISEIRCSLHGAL